MTGEKKGQLSPLLPLLLLLLLLLLTMGTTVGAGISISLLLSLTDRANMQKTFSSDSSSSSSRERAGGGVPTSGDGLQHCPDFFILQHAVKESDEGVDGEDEKGETCHVCCEHNHSLPRCIGPLDICSSFSSFPQPTLSLLPTVPPPAVSGGEGGRAC